MKRFVLATALLVIASGCSTAPHDNAARTSSARPTLALFRDGQKPTRPFHELGVLTDDGGLVEQGEIEARFIKKARKMKADAIVFHPLVRTGGEVKGFSWVETHLYKATVIAYDP